MNSIRFDVQQSASRGASKQARVEPKGYYPDQLKKLKKRAHLQMHMNIVNDEHHDAVEQAEVSRNVGVQSDALSEGESDDVGEWFDARSC